MRSKLFVPGSRPALFGKAIASAADAVSFDLEDAVAPERKAEARENLRVFLRGRPETRQIMVVRVNAVGSAHFGPDVDAVACLALQVVNLPMVEEPDAVREAVGALDAAGAAHVRILVNVETPRGLRRAAALAAAHPRVCGLQIGYADLLEPVGIDRADPQALAHIRLLVRLAAAEAGVPAFDGAFAGVDDAAGFRAECEAARRHGFAGKSCIHPTQVAAANAAFLPGPAEVERARRVLAAAAEAEQKGIGAFTVDGRMVDAPFVASARATVALADAAAGEG